MKSAVIEEWPGSIEFVSVYLYNINSIFRVAFPGSSAGRASGC